MAEPVSGVGDSPSIFAGTRAVRRFRLTARFSAGVCQRWYDGGNPGRVTGSDSWAAQVGAKRDRDITIRELLEKEAAEHPLVDSASFKKAPKEKQGERDILPF